MQRRLYFLIICCFFSYVWGAADSDRQFGSMNPVFNPSLLLHTSCQLEDEAGLHCVQGAHFYDTHATAVNMWAMVGVHKYMLDYLDLAFKRAPQGLDEWEWGGLAMKLGLMYDMAIDQGLHSKDTDVFLHGLIIQLDGYDEAFCKEFSFDGYILRQDVVSRDECVPCDWHNDNGLYYALCNKEGDELSSVKDVTYVQGMRELLQQRRWSSAANLFFSKKHEVAPKAICMVDHGLWKVYLRAWLTSARNNADISEDEKTRAKKLMHNAFWDGSRSLIYVRK